MWICRRNQNSIQSLCVTSLHVGCLLLPKTTLMKGRGNSLEINCFSHTHGVKHTLIPLLSGHTVCTACFTSQPETPTDADRVVLMWCKRVLECIKTRLKEEEEVIFFCWWSFLLGDINAAKNKRCPLSRCAFHWRWEKDTHRENKTMYHTRREVPCHAINGKNRRYTGDCLHLRLRDRHWMILLAREMSQDVS